MTNNYINILNKLINFDISNNEELTIEERRRQIKEFRNSLSYEKYSNLFNELENYILNEEIDMLEKESVIYLIIEFIRSFPILEDNINSFPSNIKLLYKSFIEYKDINLLFEQVYYTDICMVFDYIDVVNRYLDFLDKPSNELFIHYCYSKVLSLNKKLLEYLDKKEMNNHTNREIINNEELENSLINSLNVLKSVRN